MDTLFNGNPADTSQPAAPAAQPVQAPADPYADRLKAIVAEDGRQKYADVVTALDSIPHAQKRISELSEQLKQAQAEVEKRKSMEEMLNAMQQPTSQAVQPAAQPVGMNDIAALVNNTIEARAKAEAERINGNRVRDQLVAMYGDAAKAQEMFTKRAQELGVDPAYLTVQAKQYPDFVLAQFNMKSTGGPLPVVGSVNTTSLAPSQVEIKPIIRGASTKSAVEQYRAIAANLKNKQS